MNEDAISPHETKLFRQSVGQLNWASTQSRPDLAYDAFYLSTRFNKTNINDTKYTTNVIKKARKRDIFLKFQQLGKIEDLHMELFVDASLGNVEDEGYTKSMMGYFIVLSNKDGKFNPIHWKSKIIDKVAEDVKTAETLALDSALDDAIFLITEIYHGDYKNYELPIQVNEGSKSLVETLYSTKKVKRKTMRIVVSSLQQYMNKGIISNVKHVNTKQQLADVFTKKGGYRETLLNAPQKGKLV